MTPKAANGTPFSGHPSLLSDKCWGSMPALAEKCGGEFTPTAAMLFRLNPCFRVGGFFLGRNLSDTPKTVTHPVWLIIRVYRYILAGVELYMSPQAPKIFEYFSCIARIFDRFHLLAGIICPPRHGGLPSFLAEAEC